MKILFFSAVLSDGGAERVLSNLATELHRRGHDITIALNENKVTYSVPSELKIIIAPELSFNKWYNPFVHFLSWAERNIRNYKHTKKTIREVKPEVIVSFLQCNMIPIILLSHNIPIVHSEHNAYDRRLGRKNYFNRFVLNKFFDKVCVLTHFDKGYALAKKIRNATVMPNPNTFKVLSEAEYEELFPLRRNILLCGRLDAWHVKGIDLAIKMFSMLAKEFPDVDMDISGNGSELSVEKLKAMAEQEGIANRVHFLGHRNDIIDVYRQHKLFVLSSRTEGFPMVITEAMSQGLPCVSFERLASSIIIDGRDGLLVDDENIDHMVSAARKLLGNNEVRYLFGKEAIKNVDRFSASRIADRWETMLNKMIENRNNNE